MDISIIIPVYRSEKILPELVSRIKTVLKNKKYELILVNDHSPDDSWKTIVELKKKNRFIKGINLRKNFSQHNAIMAGLNYATGKVVVMMDDDLQHPPESIIDLVSKIDSGFDVCYTRYKNRRHNVFKQFGSYFANLIAKLIIGKPTNLYLSSFKAVSQDVCKEMVRYDGPYPYLDGLILQLTNNIGIVDIEHQERFEGKSNYTLIKLFSLFFKMATGFSVLPLRIISYLGFSIILLGLAITVYVTVNFFLGNTEVQGWASTVIIVMVLGGAQMFSLGFIGEYVGRIYLKLNQKPQYTIKEVC
jgi:glycosyltransferase involved in cell wall biosynthesis